MRIKKHRGSLENFGRGKVRRVRVLFYTADMPYQRGKQSTLAQPFLGQTFSLPLQLFLHFAYLFSSFVPFFLTYQRCTNILRELIPAQHTRAGAINDSANMFRRDAAFLLQPEKYIEKQKARFRYIDKFFRYFAAILIKCFKKIFKRRDTKSNKRKMSMNWNLIEQEMYI